MNLDSRHSISGNKFPRHFCMHISVCVSVFGRLCIPGLRRLQSQKTEMFCTAEKIERARESKRNGEMKMHFNLNYYNFCHETIWKRKFHFACRRRCTSRVKAENDASVFMFNFLFFFSISYLNNSCTFQLCVRFFFSLSL